MRVSSTLDRSTRWTARRKRSIDSFAIRRTSSICSCVVAMAGFTNSAEIFRSACTAVVTLRDSCSTTSRSETVSATRTSRSDCHDSVPASANSTITGTDRAARTFPRMPSRRSMASPPLHDGVGHRAEPRASTGQGPVVLRTATTHVGNVRNDRPHIFGALGADH